MLDIKFRAWLSWVDGETEKDTGKMIFTEYKELKRDVGFIAHSDMVQHMQLPNFNGIYWMQFTGLKDIKGKDIYAGDIITAIAYDTANFKTPENKKQWVSTVGFEFGMWSLGYGNFKYTRPFQSLFDAHEYIEIIGNIYQDKRLLEGDS